MDSPASSCFHCGEPLDVRTTLLVEVQGRPMPVCCAGCRAAVQLISELGLADFYTYRTAAFHPQPCPASYILIIFLKSAV